jgi:hypothetical protein
MAGCVVAVGWLAARGDGDEGGEGSVGVVEGSLTLMMIPGRWPKGSSRSLLVVSQLFVLPSGCGRMLEVV